MLRLQVDYDDNQGTTNDDSTGDGSSGLGDDGKENDSPVWNDFFKTKINVLSSFS